MEDVGDKTDTWKQETYRGVLHATTLLGSSAHVWNTCVIQQTAECRNLTYTIRVGSHKFITSSTNSGVFPFQGVHSFVLPTEQQIKDATWIRATEITALLSNKLTTSMVQGISWKVDSYTAGYRIISSSEALRFMEMLKARHWAVFRTSLIHYIAISLRSILILLSNLRLCLPSGILPWDSRTKIKCYKCYKFRPSDLLK